MHVVVVTYIQSEGFYANRESVSVHQHPVQDTLELLQCMPGMHSGETVQPGPVRVRYGDRFVLVHVTCARATDTWHVARDLHVIASRS